MRKLLFALAMLCMGAFTFGTGTPASAMDTGAIAGIADVAKADATVKVQWGHHGHHGWHHRGHWGGGYGWHHRRHWGGYGYYRPYYHHRRCWWRHGYRVCRW